ncbi:MAG: DUF4391 domain-containing protein [Deltaproteobacteria bacterium]|nr:DUF4391 domain-containing protein [Deltaproteobacteria bacterium]
MITPLFEYPKSAAFGRVLPKNKIYEHSNPTTKVRQLFIRQVEQIVWQYKLAPETINLTAVPSVREIQIFSVALKEEELRGEVLECIDRAIPFPIFFELHYENRIKSVAAYKRPSESDGSKWVISNYFETSWLTDDAARNSLPLVLDLGCLYERLLEPLMPFPSRPGEGLKATVDRMEQIERKNREVEKCEALLRREKQFNRKVAINAELRILKQELKGLTLSNQIRFN